MSELIDDQRPGGPPTGDPGLDPGATGDLPGTPAEDAPIGERLDRNPGNLGGDVAGEGDITHPVPEPGRPQM